MKLRTLGFLIALLLIVIALVPGPALAQTYLFSVAEQNVDVFIQADGTLALIYDIVLLNSTRADPMEYVDIGMPNTNYSISNISAEVDGVALSDISYSPYIDNGVALGLGRRAIPPGSSGRVTMTAWNIGRMVFTDDDDPTYASINFVPNYFDSSLLVDNNTTVRVTVHFPPGVLSDEPRWHSAPSGFPSEPETGFDADGRITYTWAATGIRLDREYKFGASFPRQYVPAEVITTPTLSDRTQIPVEDLFGMAVCFSIGAFFFVVIGGSVVSARRARLKYLPPKIAIEGHGIKRGLTAIEAAILMEQPMDKVLTMVLFAVVKKNAAEVVSRDPVELKVADPLPEGLHEYESAFLEAFKGEKRGRRRAMQKMMVELVRSVSNKMKGFSRKESVAYYDDIMRKAWAQVEAAGTPELVSAKYDEVMEWTMLDKDYGERTREVFRTRPVIIPTWWTRYDPTFGRATGTAPTVSSGGRPSSGGGGFSMPTLPGADFAASVVGGVQSFASGVVGNVADFTGGITQVTNPPPVATRSSGSRSGGSRSGGGCACACACAGCACACAGGGR